MIAYFASDLLWATRIKALADDLHIPARPVRSPEMLAARLSDSPVRALLVDLAQRDTALSLISHLRTHERQATSPPMPSAAHQAPPRARILAFGPHVQADDLRQAIELGADRVMTRGTFSDALADVLRWLIALDQPGARAQ